MRAVLKLSLAIGVGVFLVSTALVGGFLSLRSRATPTQHAIWLAQGESHHRPYGSRKEKIVTLWPCGATFSVTSEILAWNREFGNNIHLTHSELDRVGLGVGEIQSPYASVCNAVLPFNCCAAQIGEGGWSPGEFSALNLFFRVYDLQDQPAELIQRIRTKAVAEVQRFVGKTPVLTFEKIGSWERGHVSFTIVTNDYSADLNVDFYICRVKDRTIVFAFMYTNGDPHTEVIRSILDSLIVD